MDLEKYVDTTCLVKRGEASHSADLIALRGVQEGKPEFYGIGGLVFSPLHSHPVPIKDPSKNYSEGCSELLN